MAGARRVFPQAWRRTRLAVLACAALAALLWAVDGLPRAAMRATQPPETAFWDSWEAQELAKNFDLTSAWVGARARATGRRWAAVLGRRQALDDALARTCADLEAEHTPLVAANLAPWVAARGAAAPANAAAPPPITPAALAASDSRIFVVSDRVYLSHGATRGRLMPTFHALLQRVRLRVRLPDVVLPINPADEPQEAWEAVRKAAGRGGSALPRPVMSFCRTPEFADILIPNTIEGDVFVRAPDRAAARARGRAACRAGPGDPRAPRAVWRGSTGGFGGLAKGRAALLALGQSRPDIIDSGVYDWDEAKWGPAAGRQKPPMSVREQVDGFKYLVWVPGNCASVRLALQLASDAVVLKVESPEQEWYYPLLKPHVHYIPIHANATHTDLEQAVAAAEADPEAARRIALASTLFAERHLSERGRDCYFMRLLRDFARLQPSPVTLPADAEYTPTWACCR